MCFMCLVRLQERRRKWVTNSTGYIRAISRLVKRPAVIRAPELTIDNLTKRQRDLAVGTSIFKTGRFAMAGPEQDIIMAEQTNLQRGSRLQVNRPSNHPPEILQVIEVRDLAFFVRFGHGVVPVVVNLFRVRVSEPAERRYFPSSIPRLSRSSFALAASAWCRSPNIPIGESRHGAV